jgi:branched-chain amino acid transport system permease protein
VALTAGVRGRPELFVSYERDMALLNTPAKRWGALAVFLSALALPLMLTDDVLLLFASGFALAIGAIGLNLVTGYAGQVSLGHAFFLGLGAYTAAVLGGQEGRAIGLGLPMLVWLPASGLVTALAGALVAPLALRLRGLYLAIVTLGLVFLGEHIFKEMRNVTGGAGVGRATAPLELFGWPITRTGEVFTGDQKSFWFMLVLLVVFGVCARNLARSDVGRAFAAVRDRDVAAAVIGVSLTRQKVLAFVISSFDAGVCGALYYGLIGFVEPGSFNLLLSVQFVAMVLIGGVATISGSIAGALFIALLPRFTQELPRYFDFISARATGRGLLSVFDIEAILYGLLIIGFLIFEPRGLFGIWIRVRNYWKQWPFSY